MREHQGSTSRVACFSIARLRRVLIRRNQAGPGWRSHTRFLDEPDEHSHRCRQPRRARRRNRVWVTRVDGGASLSFAGCQDGHLRHQGRTHAPSAGSAGKSAAESARRHGLSQPRKPRAFIFATSTVRFWRVRSIERGFGVGPRCLETGQNSICDSDLASSGVTSHFSQAGGRFQRTRAPTPKATQ